jgi:hypothetical protein
MWRRRAIRVHRAPLGEVDRSVRFGIPVTSVARTLGDRAHELDDEATYRMVREPSSASCASPGA